MKSILNVLAICAVVALAGCNKSNSVSPGAMGSEKSGCCTGDKSTCTEKKATGTNMGAVSDKKSGCCAEKAAVSPGAVGETKPGCAAHCTSGTKKVDG